jgi:hypothetical protein
MYSADRFKEKGCEKLLLPAVCILALYTYAEPTAPGSISMILIPNGSNSYCIDSDRPSKANLVP